MKRRALLATGGAALVPPVSGCLGNTFSDDGGGDANEHRQLIVDDVQADDDLEQLSLELDLVSNRLAETDGPTLDITVENTGDQSVSWWHGGSGPSIAFPQRYIEPGGLRIGFTEEVEAQKIDVGDGCARTETGLMREDASVETHLESGHTLGQRYAIVGVNDELDGVCPPPDTYRAEYEYDELGVWGFEFTLNYD